jgi:protoporphyrin/coproporphyrin ferrochelatase
MTLAYDAVLLIAFGGPAGPEEIRPFLERVTKGIPIPLERLAEVAHHYEAVGGKSPLNEITFRQANALQESLKKRGSPLPVYVGMRNASPFFTQTFKRMAADGVTRALGIILSSLRTEASWERYQQNVADARSAQGPNAPMIDYCGGWHDHPRFIQTWAEQLEASLAKIPPDRRLITPIIFTAHSLPVPMAARSPYVEQLGESARLIAQQLNHWHWFIAYQSRSGKPTDPWLEPDVGELIRDLGSKGVSDIIIAPIGFVCDHVEVLYDLDIEAKRIAESSGVGFVRAACPNDHPTFIEMIADIVQSSLAGPSPASR